MTKLAAVMLALSSGIASTMQATTNAGLARATGLGPALVVNTTVVLLGVIGLWIALGADTEFFPPETGWPYYLGGLFGFTTLACITLVFPRIGAVYAMGLMIGGQCLAALAIDQLGLLGMPVNPVTLQRLLGVVLVGLGAVLVRGG